MSHGRLLLGQRAALIVRTAVHVQRSAADSNSRSRVYASGVH